MPKPYSLFYALFEENISQTILWTFDGIGLFDSIPILHQFLTFAFFWSSGPLSCVLIIVICFCSNKKDGT